MKKFLTIMCSVLLLGATSCSNNDTSQQAEKATENVGTSETETSNDTENTTENVETTSETEASNDTEDYFWLPHTKGKNEILLYDRFYNCVVRYNKNSYEIVSSYEFDYLQYGFDSLDTNIYTSWFVEEDNFNIVRLNDDSTELIFQSNKGDALAPLIYQDEESIYMIKSKFDDAGKEMLSEKVICKFNAKTKQLEDIQSTKGLNTFYGALIDDTLYFTTGNDTDVENYSYELYKMNIKEDKKPELMVDNLADGEIYNNNGSLWISDKENIYDYKNKENKFSKKGYNYFYNDYLFQVTAEDDTEDMSLYITNTKTKEEVDSFAKMVDFKVSDNKVTVYTKSEIATLELDK